MWIKTLITMVIVPQLLAWSNYFANKDADFEGTDDRVARILKTAGDELMVYLQELENKPKV